MRALYLADVRFMMKSPQGFDARTRILGVEHRLYDEPAVTLCTEDLESLLNSRLWGGQDDEFKG